MSTHRWTSSRTWILAAVAAGALGLAGMWWTRPQPPAARAPFITGGPLSTARADLGLERKRLLSWLETHPGDASATVRLAQLSLREARVTGNDGLVVDATARLRAVARSTTQSYEVERMLATVLLSEHRFVEAGQIATRLVAQEPGDTWLHGVLGDAALERGNYDVAFAAFDRMAAARPDAAAYARVAYARELSGDVEGALRVMEMALSASSPHDVEAHAWHLVQQASLQLQLGRLGDARLSVERALFTFPGYAPALATRAEVHAAGGELRAALASMQEALAQAPSAGWLARAGDFHQALGDRDEAERVYLRADAAWESGTPEPREHALFLAMHGRDLPRALRLARKATSGSEDIVSLEALAWSAYRNGDLETARHAIERALRTGSRHRRLRVHAAAILQSAGEGHRARDLMAGALPQPALEIDMPSGAKSIDVASAQHRGR